MSRPVPIGRDRLGILGGPVGAVAALSGTHANHAIGLNDLLCAVSANVGRNSETYTYLYAADSAGVFRLGVRNSDGVPFVEIAANRYFSNAAIPNPWGRVVDLAVFVDRSASAYFYADGAACGSVDVSADVATDITSQQAEIGGVCVAGSGRVYQTQSARLFVIIPANFPDATARAAIVSERDVNPDAESPTLLLRPNYATERRVDIDFVDVDQDGTTVPNLGTGAATFTIGGGIHWHDARTQAERAAISIPEEDWYAIDATHIALNAAADLGCMQGSYVVEWMYSNAQRGVGFVASNPFAFMNAGATERLLCYADGNIFQIAFRSNGVFSYCTIQSTGWSAYGMGGIHLLHLVYNADTNQFIPICNGQVLLNLPIVTDLNLSGNIYIQMSSGCRRDGVMALRLWNAASLPADWAAIIKRRVVNPWTVTDGFTGMTLYGNWTGRKTAQAPTDTFLENEAQPGIGRLVISGGAQWQNARVLAVKGLT